MGGVVVDVRGPSSRGEAPAQSAVPKSQSGAHAAEIAHDVGQEKLREFE